MTRLVIFTDLDGTLLDHETYSFAPAEPALKKLKDAGAPLIMVSSKTRQEMEALRDELGINHPFIPENGGAIYIPEKYDLAVPSTAVSFSGYRVIELGRRTREIAPLFDRLASRVPIRALSRLRPAEITALTGLSPEQAEAAKNREFGEVFVLDDPDVSESELASEVARLGLHLTRGGRFYHLLGENDKGKATRILADLYRDKYSQLITAGFGDAPNDRPMLAAVDRPYQVAKRDGSHESFNVPGLTRLSLPGPSGFNKAVLDLLEELK